MFKSVTHFTMSGPIPDDIENINQKLASAEFTPCSGSQLVSMGFQKFENEDVFIKKSGEMMVINFAHEKKSIPAAVVKMELDKKISEYISIHGKKPSEEEKNDFKDAIHASLIPRAFPKRTEVKIILDGESGIAIITTGTASLSEDAIKFLRIKAEDMPQFSIPSFDLPVSNYMGKWLLDGKAPGDLELDDKAELVGGGESKPTVKYSRHNLDISEIKDYIIEGRVVKSMAMSHNESFSFLLTDKMAIKSIKASNLIKGKVLDGELDTSAELFLYAHGISSLINDLVKAMGGYRYGSTVSSGNADLDEEDQVKEEMQEAA